MDYRATMQRVNKRFPVVEKQMGPFPVQVRSWTFRR